MLGAMKLNIRNKQTTKRIVALALLIFIIIAVLLSGAFILTHANHKHDHNGVGGGCMTCVQIHNTKNLLKQLGIAVAAIPFGLMGLFVAIAVLRSALHLIGSYTLINLKIRLNN